MRYYWLKDRPAMTPYWLRQMADWFDTYQETIRKLDGHPPGTVITPGTEMQVLLRGWADDLEAAEAV